MKKIHFVSGLPRACSTLLCNILSQNPNFHATSTSGLSDLASSPRRIIATTQEFKSMNPKDSEKILIDWVRAGILNAYNSITDRPTVFDKSRGWLGHLDLLFQAIPSAKVIIPVRDLRGILSSFEKRRKKHPAFAWDEEENIINFSTIEKRVNNWLNSTRLGLHLERLQEACKTHKEKLFFVHAERLTLNPLSEIKKLYQFLEEDYFEHDFENVKQYTKEHDAQWWPIGDHTIRPEVKPLKQEWNEILGFELSNSIHQKLGWVNHL